MFVSSCGLVLTLVAFMTTSFSRVALGAIIVRSVTTNSRFDQHVSVGDKVSLSCELTEAYSSQIKWRKVEGRLTDDSSDYAGVLTLYSVRKEDNGEYECVVRNNPRMRSRARLTVVSARSSRFTPEIEANEGSQVEIHCEIKNEPELKWRKLDGEISKYKTEYGAPDNRLLVYYLTEQDEGDYECYLPNGETSRVKLHIIKNIDNSNSHNYGSYELPAADAGYESAGNRNQNQQTDDGSSNNSQQPEEYNSYDNNNNDRERYDDHDQQRPEDQRSRDDDQNRDNNNNYNQQQEGSEQQQSVVERDVGSNVQLECQLPTRDYNEIKWRRIGGALSLYARPNENKLQIDYLELSDSGVYECYTINRNGGGGGASSRRVSLKVREVEQDEFGTTSNYYSTEEDYKLPAEASVESRIDKSRSENVEIACGLTPNYQLVRWRKLNGEMEDNVRVYQNILYIGDLKDSNAGYYECYLENDPSRTSRFALNIVPYPTAAGSTHYYNTASTPTAAAARDETTPTYDADYNQISENSGDEEAVENNNDIQASLEPSSLTVRAGESGEISCTAFTSRQSIDIEWYNDKDELIKQDAPGVSFSSRLTKYQPLTIQSILRVDSARPDYAGRYECRVTSLDQSKSIHFDVRVSDDDSTPTREEEYTTDTPFTRGPDHHDHHDDDRRYPPYGQDREQDHHHQTSTDHYHPNVEVEREQQPRRPCEYYEATCRNGQCISKSGLCDGRRDCDDGSDEDTCGPVSTNICQPNERVCSRTRKCVQKIWWCDGEPDCDHGEDEQSCSTASRPGEACKSTEFSCSNRRQCISKSFLCDKEKDCQDSSDEIGCEPPRILKPPTRNLTVRIGGTFRIECQAVGFPSPFINWRLNWGHVCDEPRCYATNEQGRGVFTVTDVRYADAGAYSCEAINGMGRTFAVPDCIVSIQPGPTPPTTTARSTTTTTTTRRTTTNIPQPQVSDCAIMCHNHTDMCTCSGQCLNCQHNTWGTKCEKCLPGFVGDATRGTPYDCRRVGEILELQRPTSFMPSAPQPVPELDASQSCRDMCHNHSDNCTCSFCFNCQHNTKGKKCEQCADGYVGDATRGTPYDCVRIGQNVEPVVEITPPPPPPPPPAQMNQCDPKGTLRTERDGRCKCKANVNGRFCEHCKPYSFDLERVSPYGCHRCFCNGLNVDCRSSDSYYTKLVADFEQDIQDWKISDKYLSRRESLETVDAKIEFAHFDDFDSKDLFFLVPSKFKGNKLGSYGGLLSFKIYFETSGGQDHLKPLEIRIAGNNVNVFYIHPDELLADTENQISVELFENEFLRYGDNRTVNRDHMMMMLANIDTIMIRASYSHNQKLVRLYDFELEYASASAEDSNNGVGQSGEAHQAKSVEVCSCPAGYSGTSCESCDSGYRRARAGFYLGLCERY